MSIDIVQVDAFTAVPFAGNPAGVCLLDAPAPVTWMQAVAAEMNLSETAFVSPGGDGYDLRWFTPAVEVDLCGHATLATAHVLRERGAPSTAVVRFHTRSGLLTARFDGAWIELDFPAKPAVPVPVPDGLAEALGAAPVRVERSHFDLLVELASEGVVRGLEPDIAAVSRVDARGVIVTAAASEPGVDFVSRFFAPRVGVPEDPVTGSAHCCLAPFWARRFGRDALTGYQASRRGGTVRVRAAGDRVILAGEAVTVLQGRLRPAPVAEGAS